MSAARSLGSIGSTVTACRRTTIRRGETDCPQSPTPPAGGIRDYEGILHDNQYGPIPREAGLDTLYTSTCHDWPHGVPSTWHGAVIAQRYQSTAADMLLGRPQGRTVIFLFQPYLFMEGPMIDAGTAAINWLMTGGDYWTIPLWLGLARIAAKV